MKCATCKEIISIKDQDKSITLKCKCGVILIHPDKTMKNITKESYNPHYDKPNQTRQ